ncbi:MAG: hypothetical protein JSW67_14550 [Candidatus Latescibacterota bacterium]|nr:MAG: hypothetical protein JSW67_14550 [Candidatus Latescibacterota bacterium]
MTPLGGTARQADIVLRRDDWVGMELVSVEDLLRQQAGVVVARRGGLGSHVYLNVAGSVTGRIRVLVDGVDYTESEFQWPRVFSMLLVEIDRIELHRSVEPARLEIWTRKPDADAPVTEIDLGRGEVGTRTRRVQLHTPTQSWWVGFRYDELLRGFHDFRTQRLTSAPADLGTYNGRGRAVDVGFQRPTGERLLYRFEDYLDTAHGSFESVNDFSTSSRVLNALRWQRGVRGLDLTLDVSHQGWNRERRINAIPQTISEVRGRAALDLELPHGNLQRTALYMRVNDVEGERFQDDMVQRADYARYDVELFTRRGSDLFWNAGVGWHRDERFGNSWSAQAQLLSRRDAWEFDVEAGRGVTFRGWGEEESSAGTRPGTYAAAGVRHAGPSLELGCRGYYKDLQKQSSAAQLFFPTLGLGPRRIGAALVDVILAPKYEHLSWALEGRLAWTPWTAGDRGGMADLHAELTGRFMRWDLFQGDLEVTLQTIWRLETRRVFTDTVSLPAVATGDVMIDVRLLQRLLLFWRVINVTDTRWEIHPGVLMPQRWSLFGVRATLIN